MKLTEQEIDQITQRLISFCVQLARPAEDPIREQIKEIARLAKIGAAA